MAEFCKACSIELYGKDLKELANITTESDLKRARAASVLCEGCGPIQVDQHGNCVSDCLKSGKEGHGMQVDIAVEDYEEAMKEDRRDEV